MNRPGSIHSIVAAGLRSARLARGLTQAELASATGLHVTAVSRFECGNGAPSAANLKALCKALNISADYLLGLPDNLPKSP